LELFERTREEGLLIGKGGLYGNVIRITPPLTVDEAEIEHAVRILDRAFEKVSPLYR
jgi:4-aminobutyrate aminotransferase-like enzyme